MADPVKDEASLRVFFVDVGQGDACLIQTPSQHFYLFDTGNDEAAILNFLKKMRVDTLSALFISHPDLDHYGAFLSILEDFPIKKVFLPVETSTSPTWTDLILALDDAQVEKETLLAGDTLIWDEGIRVRTLWPYSQVNYAGNNLSTVLRLEYKAHSLLLTGDIEDPSELEILGTRQWVQSDILKVAHHGSHSSSSLPFLAAVQATYAIISCDSAVYGHPHPETLANLNFILGDSTRILRTDRLGTLGFALTPGGIQKL